ncbi:hydroxylysine kinase-like [Hydractinia symbiolongicarpus]|uniref:hydroxylysine kinase-like n=1 Tax=Hydractinia symbiolongicarpus TaxID=13093 RepID=UPI002550C97A|nr:hydroxylysine kinase-like [Hydractinia symbiolongicarpus]
MSQKVTIVTSDVVKIRPFVDKEQIKEIAEKCFGLQIDECSEIKEAISYDDRNFIFKGKLNARGNQTDEVYQCFDKFVLKIYNASQTPGFPWFSHINGMVAAIYEKCQNNFKVPLPIGDVKSNGNCVLYDIPLEKNVEASEELLQELCLNNKFVSKENSWYFVKHVVRLTAFIPGQVIEIKSMDDDMAFCYGKCAAQLDTVLKTFPKPHVDYRSDSEWNMVNIDKMLDLCISTMTNEERKGRAVDLINKFKSNVVPKLENLPKQWIHSDINEFNVLKNNYDKIVGIIDFDDMTYSYRVIDVGIALMHISYSATKERCFRNIQQFLRGYISISPLEKNEINLLYTIMLARYIQCSIAGEYWYNCIAPGNEYLLVVPNQAWNTLSYIMNEGESKFYEVIS